MTAIDVRNQVVERMRWMNLRHAHHAWEQRYRDPLAPYGLALLFVQPDPIRPGRLWVKAATKLWLHGPETEHLPRLLFDMNNLVAQRLRDGVFDLRTELTNRIDKDMADDAYYVGIGLSSLDTHTGVWEQTQRRVEDATEVPGAVVTVLTDQTTIVCSRRGMSEFNAFQIHSTHSLGRGIGINPWSWSQPEQLRADPTHAETLRWLDELNHTLWQADNARIDAARRNTQRRGQHAH